MFKKISALALLLLSLSSVQAVDSQEVECLSTNLNETEEEMNIRRKKGCECLCCLSVTGNASIGGTLTVGGRSVNSLFAQQTFASFYNNTHSVTLTQDEIVPFNTSGPTSGSGITNNGNGSITLSAIGTYEVTWNAEIDQTAGTPTQFALFLNGTIIPSTVIGQNNSANFPVVIGNSVFITTTTVNSVLTLELISASNVTMNFENGDSATITIKRLS